MCGKAEARGPEEAEGALAFGPVGVQGHFQGGDSGSEL